jgi:hypothetical protein
MFPTPNPFTVTIQLAAALAAQTVLISSERTVSSTAQPT